MTTLRLNYHPDTSTQARLLSPLNAVDVTADSVAQLMARASHALPADHHLLWSVREVNTGEWGVYGWVHPTDHDVPTYWISTADGELIHTHAL